MKKIIFLISLAFFSLASYATVDYNVVTKAMQDEMNRAKKELKMKGFDKPYYIAYYFKDSESVKITASLGALVSSVTPKYKDIEVSIRVGDYKFDNSNFKVSFFDSDYPAYQTPGDGYGTIRAALWQETDNVYKEALETLSKKKGFMKQKNITDYYDDFSPAAKVNLKEEKNTEKFDKEYFEALSKQLSAIGLKYPEIEKFVVRIIYNNENKYYLDNLGSSYYNNPVEIILSVESSVRAADGFLLENSFEKNFALVTDFPPSDKLMETVKEFASDTAAQSKAVKAEPYIGPILLYKYAAAEFFMNLFVYNIEKIKPEYSDKGTFTNAGEFKDRLGLKVISNIFDVTDNPLAKEYKGAALSGYYRVDDEGVKAQKVDIVKHGKLVNFLTTRSLIKGQKGSTGHGKKRGMEKFPSALTSNIFFTPLKTIPYNELKSKLREECAKQELEYCLMAKGGLGNNFTVYKIYTNDGREEVAYGARMMNNTPRALRDIIYAGDDIDVYNFYRGSLIAPSVIISEMEISPIDEKPVRKPLVSRP
ncbi:Zn-dependent protease-like protein [Elusimicrobium minutum Pei191]|uniref:Zn-dependent protease-like protein n=1 Tax=Elusimicrobium minutum (strain Pei191) TaxID=445932 RepID=B2KAR8_ELUMP|nr:metallopeptidase TldD-related protein [Elusimicrobium minutum]ACC97614.1 Zn-dependent protease-like protein [Elusimicrobium minutum Pei191]